jgi:hypothetical protein
MAFLSFIFGIFDIILVNISYVGDFGGFAALVRLGSA